MASSAYRIGPTGSKGRGVFASTDLSAGHVVFELQRPLVIALDTPALDFTCEWCFNGIGEAALGQAATADEEVKLFRCSGCKLVKYCSKTCQAQAWKHHHKLECKSFAALAPRVLPNAPRMIVQLLLRKRKGLIDEKEWSSFMALQHHANSFKQSLTGRSSRQMLQVTAMAAKQYGDPAESMDHFEELAGRLYINTQTLVNPIFHPLGQCLDPLPASVNHSCMPNAVITFSGPVMTLRTTTNVAKDEEITISYIDPTPGRDVRRQELSSRYFFECKCEACMKDLCFGLPRIPTAWSGPADSDKGKGVNPYLKSLLELDAAASKQLQKAEQAFGQSRSAQSMEAQASGQNEYYLCMCKGLSLYLQQDDLDCYPPGRQPLAKLRFDTIVELLARSLFVPALILSLQNYYDVDPLHFPYVCHPVRVVHAYTLSRLAQQMHYLDGTRDAEVQAVNAESGMHGRWIDVAHALLAEVRRCAARSHGDASRLTRQVHAEVAQVLQHVPQARRVLDLQPPDDRLGIRDEAVWKGPCKLARTGWRWYCSVAAKNANLDPGLQILVKERQESLRLLKPKVV